jgi:hypothetical protein
LYILSIFLLDFGSQIIIVIFKNAVATHMQFLCKRKISIHSSTPLHGYPTIRLPREFKTLIGETTRIYLSEEEDKLAFKFIIDKKVGKVCANLERSHMETRLAALESQISELKSLLLLNENVSSHKNKKEAPESGFEPESEPRQGSMIGRYTTRACTSVMAA